LYRVFKISILNDVQAQEQHVVSTL